MIRKHKKFNRPRQSYDSARIADENKIVEKYGLKNKREIWKAKAKLDVIRRTAKKLVNLGQEEQERFLVKLKKMGFKVANTVEVLALTEEDILNRRLQTILVSKRLATTAKGARQLITHRHVLVNGKVITIPSYMVPIDEETLIRLDLKAKKAPVKKEVVQEKEEAGESEEVAEENEEEAQ